MCETSLRAPGTADFPRISHSPKLGDGAVLAPRKQHILTPRRAEIPNPLSEPGKNALTVPPAGLFCRRENRRFSRLPSALAEGAGMVVFGGGSGVSGETPDLG